MSKEKLELIQHAERVICKGCQNLWGSTGAYPNGSLEQGMCHYGQQEMIKAAKEGKCKRRIVVVKGRPRHVMFDVMERERQKKLKNGR